MMNQRQIYLRFEGMRIIPSLLLLLITFLIFSCIKAPEYPIEPEITLQGISTDTMRQGNLNNDSIIIFIGLTDGDGDIGSDDGEFDVIVTDLRDNFVSNRFRLPKVDEIAANNGISGNLQITVYTTCCVFPNGQTPCTTSEEFPTDEIQYQIQIFDQAGNPSNKIMTPPVTLLCDGS